MSETDSPEIHGWRIKAAEESLRGLHEKVDRLSSLVERNSCPSPGLCMQLQTITDRLSQIVEKHDQQITDVKTDITVAKTSGKILIAAATAVGTIVAAVVSIALDIWNKK